jgi:O-antigen/teichoic acid export membrane protein
MNQPDPIKSRNIAANYASLFGGKVVTKLLTFLAMIFIARYLGEDDFGRLNFAFALASLATVAAQAGLSNLNIREIARHKENSSQISGTVSLIRWMNLAWIIIVTGLFAIGAQSLFGWPANSGWIILLGGLGFAFATMGATYIEIFQAFERMEFVAVIFLITNALNLLLVLGIIFMGWGLLEVGAAFILSNCCGWAAGYLMCRRLFPIPRLGQPLNLVWSYLKESWPFMASAIVAMVYWRTDTITLTAMVGVGAAGIYNAAGRLTEGLLLVPSTYREAIYPNLSRTFLTDPDSYRETTRRSYKYLIALALPVAVGTSILANPIVRFIYGDQYQGTEMVLAIIIWALATIFIREFTAGQLFSMNKQKSVLSANLTAAVLNVILNITLIPYFSWIGASVAMVASAAVSMGMNLWTVKKASPGSLVRLGMIRSVASAAVLGVVLWLAREHTTLHVLILIPAGLLLYSLILILSGFFNRAELRFFFTVFKRKQPAD